MQNGVEQEKTLEIVNLIKYSSPKDVNYLSVIVEQNLTRQKNMFNNCTALKVINSVNGEQPTNQEDNSLTCFATFNRTKEQIDNEIIRNEIGKLLGINMPSIYRISTSDRKQDGLIIDTNLKSDTIPTIASQIFSDKKAVFMKMNRANAIKMNDFIAYFPTEEDLKNPQTTFAMLLKGASSLPYKQISSQREQKKFIEEYYDMIVLDLLTGQKNRNGQDYYYYIETKDTPKGPITSGHVIPGLLNYSMKNEDEEASKYYLNDFPVDIDVLMDKLFTTSSYMFIQRVVDSLISSIVNYKDCISRIIYNNTSIENAKKLEELIFSNIDRFVAKAHSTRKITGSLNKIEKVTTTTKMNLESVNRIIEFQHRYPTSKQEILDNASRITRLKENANGDYEATIEDGVKLTLAKDENLEATGYTSSGLLSALIAFVCGLGFGLAYIISHLK